MRQLGLSLVEQIVFIVVVGVAVAGVLAVVNVATHGSADPMIQKQAVAIAEALIEEVQLQPFTYCDPDDANAATALSAADCTGGVGGANDENKLPLGSEAGETRTSAATPFDNVSDYNNFGMGPGFTDINGNAISGLDAYSATVSITNQALGTIPSSDALLITVSVTGPANTSVTLHGYRVRYAPNALP
ncbi:MAG: type II secretion system protein [Betaproteobacteria bacterium]|nr:type II secretion system protein [Betaproteobacteria bacterium]